jgi:hypothetical protein
MQAPIRDMFQEAFAARQGFRLSEEAKRDQPIIQARAAAVQKANQTAQQDAVGAILDTVSRVSGTDIEKTSGAATKQIGVSISGFFKAGMNTLANTMGSTFSRALLGTTNVVDVAGQVTEVATAVSNAISENAAAQTDQMTQQVTQATKAATPAKKPTTRAAVTGAEEGAEVQRVDLKVTAICYHCKKELERESPHRAGTNPGTKNK